jgi:hypothetical protein
VEILNAIKTLVKFKNQIQKSSDSQEFNPDQSSIRANTNTSAKNPSNDIGKNIPEVKKKSIDDNSSPDFSKKPIVKAFNESTPVKTIGKFELGTFAEKTASRKLNQKDRFPQSELEDTVKNITESYRASNDSSNYRYGNTAHVAHMPDGEVRVIYTRPNSRGVSEILNWHKISDPKYLDTLRTY